MKHFNVLINEDELIELLTLISESQVLENSKRFKTQQSILKQCAVVMKLKSIKKPVCN